MLSYVPIRTRAALLCLSAGLLAYELLLMRLLSLVWWGHFAGFVISVAMLGLACAGLLLHFQRGFALRRPLTLMAWSACGFAVSAPATFALSQQLPFAPFLLTWSLVEFLRLGLRILLFALPFFLAGIAIGTPFVARILPTGQLYFWNMLGSALPAVPLLLAMGFLHPGKLLLPVAALALLGAVLAGGRRIAVVGIVAVAAIAQSLGPFQYSQYKAMSKTLLLPDARLVAEYQDPDGLVHVVDSPHTRWIPGLSLNFIGELPESKLLFTDASSMEVVFNPDEALHNPEFLDAAPEALAYRLIKAKNVLLLTPDAPAMLRATSHGVSELTVLDNISSRANARTKLWSVVELDKPWNTVTDEARHYLASNTEHWDLVQVSLLGSHGASSAGAASLNPDWLLTRQGFDAIWNRLSERGIAVFSAWVENPPRSGSRLTSWLVDGLRRHGIGEPGAHILAVRGWATLTVFVGSVPFDNTAVGALRRFATEQDFDLVYHWQMSPADANRLHRIPDAPYFHAFAALLGPNAEDYLARSPFHLEVPSDDAPYFSHFFRWTAVPALTRDLGRDWLPYIEWGYLVQFAALVLASLLGLGLLILPCVLIRGSASLHTGMLFLLLGLAFMFIELWAMFRLSLFLSRPQLSSALVLTVLLAASGAGAFALTRWARPRITLAALIAALAVAIVSYPWLFETVFTAGIGLRTLVAALWLLPPALLMGFPYPYALSHLDGAEVPWALALNGFGSVLGGLAATLISVHAGLNALAATGLVLYVLAAFLILYHHR